MLCKEAGYTEPCEIQKRVCAPELRGPSLRIPAMRRPPLLQPPILTLTGSQGLRLHSGESVVLDTTHPHCVLHITAQDAEYGTGKKGGRATNRG